MVPGAPAQTVRTVARGCCDDEDEVELRFWRQRPRVEPEFGPELEQFRDGLAVLRREGQPVGHVATSLGHFRTPFAPRTPEPWVWLVVVWADGVKESAVEDYPPWSHVAEMRAGYLEWVGGVDPDRAGRYDLEWVPSRPSAYRQSVSGSASAARTSSALGQWGDRRARLRPGQRHDRVVLASCVPTCRRCGSSRWTRYGGYARHTALDLCRSLSRSVSDSVSPAPGPLAKRSCARRLDASPSAVRALLPPRRTRRAAGTGLRP